MKENITTHDLRLGNWLYYSEYTHYVMQVCLIDENSVYLDIQDNKGDCFENSNKEIYPIPLTFNFLGRAGFNESYDGINISLDDFSLENKMSGFVFPMGNISIPIKYVHELQNIFYMFKNKELYIKREWLLVN